MKKVLRAYDVFLIVSILSAFLLFLPASCNDDDEEGDNTQSLCASFPETECTNGCDDAMEDCFWDQCGPNPGEEQDACFNTDGDSWVPTKEEYTEYCDCIGNCHDEKRDCLEDCPGFKEWQEKYNDETC